MADSRSIVTRISMVVALVSLGWAIYASKHQTNGGGFAPPAGGGAVAGARPAGPGGGAPGARPSGAGAIAVITSVARSETLDVGIEALGTAKANEAVDITSKISNIVTAIHFRDGEQVKAGQVLVELDAAQATADLAAATADFTDSVSQFNRSRELVATQALSKAQFEQLESAMKANQARVAAAKAKFNDTYIRAPFSGRVGLRRVSLGTLISPGTVIATLDDTSVIKVDFAVPDVFVGSLRDGLTVTASTTAIAGRMFEGRVTSVDSRIDPSTRSVMVRAVLPNRDAQLRPGMFLTVSLAKDRREALVIPEEALVPEQSKQFVYVVQDGKARKREVQIGLRQPGRVEVSAGLTVGEIIVTEGTQKIREGSTVRELQAAAGPVVKATT
ncbi:MAG: efflux RND transporter periplasmic adaptor subunit [Steroidobacteraceae bacterium]